MAKTITYLAHSQQSHFDLSVQLYGDISQIGEILKNIDDINGEIALGTAFSLPEQVDPTAIFFKNRIVATDIPEVIIDFLTVDSGLITVDSGLITADQTIE
jgi:hypothetical protein